VTATAAAAAAAEAPTWRRRPKRPCRLGRRGRL